MTSPDQDLTGKVAIFALGGTIAMVPGVDIGAVPRLDANDLVKAVPALAAFDIDAVSFRQKPGAHLTFDDIESLAGQIEKACERGATGVVVTQGTDTIEDVAFALDLLLSLPRPVVVTGAMRNPSLAGADGPANLLAAVQVARSPVARDLGVLVVFNDELHAARFVTKQHTTNVAAFVSPNAGKLGWLSEGAVVVPLTLSKGPCIARLPDPRPAHVPLLTLTLDFDIRILKTLAETDVDALVVEALGGGHCGPEVAVVLADIAAEKPVILASRTGAGQVLRNTYGFPGSEMDLLRKGLVDSGWIDGRKARILTALAMRHGASPQRVGDLFTAFRG